MGEPTLAEIISEAEAQGVRENAFEAWLTENKKGAELFWAVMRDAYKGNGTPFTHCLRAWRKHFPDSPTRVAQTVKKMVDERLADE